MNFSNTQEIVDFESRLQAYVRTRGDILCAPYSLATAYDICKIRWSGRVFSALVDLRINSALVSCDLTETHGLCKRLEDKCVDGSAYLVDDSVFQTRMRIHHLISGVAFRYRALWDKLCDFLLMLGLKNPRSDEENERIIKEAGITKGKQRFREVIRKTPFNPDWVVAACKYLEHFDSTYRTPEAHSAGGSISKWTLSPHAMMDTPILDDLLLNAWNLWVNVENWLEAMFGDKAFTLLRGGIENSRRRSAE